MQDAKKPRRARVDCAGSVAAAIQASRRVIEPPAGARLDRAERAVFDEIIGEFAKVDLTEHQVRLATLLAKEMHQANAAQTALSTEGSVIVNARGNATLNPRVRVVQQHIATILSLRRSLGLTARALAGGDSRRVAIRRAHNRANQAIMDDIDPEGLMNHPDIPPPNSNRRH